MVPEAREGVEVPEEGVLEGVLELELEGGIT